MTTKKMTFAKWLAANESTLGLKAAYDKETKSWTAEAKALYPKHVAECKGEEIRPLTQAAFLKIMLEEWPSYEKWCRDYYRDAQT